MTKSNRFKSLFWLVIPKGKPIMATEAWSRKVRNHIFIQCKKERENEGWSEAVNS